MNDEPLPRIGNSPELEALFESNPLVLPVVPETKGKDDKVTETNAPTGEELERYRQILQMTRLLGREPTAIEAFPILKGTTRLRGKTWCGDTLGPDTSDEKTRAPPAKVNKVMRRLVRSVAAFLSDAERVSERLAELADSAMKLAEECLDPRGQFGGPELKVRADIAMGMLRICGLSNEPQRGRGSGGGDTNTHVVNLNVGGRDKGDTGESEVDRLRRELYRSKMGERA